MSLCQITNQISSQIAKIFLWQTLNHHPSIDSRTNAINGNRHGQVGQGSRTEEEDCLLPRFAELHRGMVCRYKFPTAAPRPWTNFFSRPNINIADQDAVLDLLCRYFIFTRYNTAFPFLNNSQSPGTYRPTSKSLHSALEGQALSKTKTCSPNR